MPEANNITHIVIGKSERSRWFEMLHGSVVHDLVRRAGNISVHVIAGGRGRGVAGQDRSHRRPSAEPFDIMPYIATTAIVAVALGHRLRAPAIPQRRQHRAGLPDRDPDLGGAPMGCCLRSIACFVSVLAYNFFFLPPLYTFTIADPENVVALFFFLIVAVIAATWPRAPATRW